MTLHASQRREGEILVLEPKGSIETPHVKEFEKSIHDGIEAGNSKIIIDMREVEAIDTAAVRSLLSIAARLVARRGRLVICGLGSEIIALFTITAFDRVVRVVDTHEEAIASLQ